MYRPVLDGLCGDCGHGRMQHRGDRCGGHRALPEGYVLKLVRERVCDCVHPPEVHDPTTGACLLTNPTFGPCVCRATPDETRAALEVAWNAHRREAAR